jgi:hypothetical protein
VIFKPVPKQQLCKQTSVKEPLLGNRYLDTGSLVTKEHATMKEALSVRSVLELYNDYDLRLS